MGIEIKILDTTYNIRTTWNEVTFKDYCEIVKAKGKPIQERIVIYTGIPFETIVVLSVKQIITIGELVEFMDEPELVNAFAVGYESELKVGEEPYWKVEKCKQFLKENPHPVTAGAEIVELYTGDADGNGGMDIRDKPVTEVIGVVTFFLQICQPSLSDSNA